MPHRTYSLSDVAEYLHLTKADVEKLAKRNEIPFVKKGDKFFFHRSDIDAWASQRLLASGDKGLKDFHKKSSVKAHNLSKKHAIIADLLKPDYIDPALKSKTKASILGDMVKLAEKTDLLLDSDELLKSLKEREQMCSTALAGGLALLHPRQNDPYLFEDSFIVLGRTVQPIPFGSPDGTTTDLFFLVCCQDAKTHLHVLARLCVLCYQTSMLLELREAKTAEDMFQGLIAAEKEVIHHL